MFKKILKWTVYAGVVGLLIFGAVIRTEAKAGQEGSQPEMRLESKSSGSLGQGGEGNLGQSGEGNSRAGNVEDLTSRSGSGSGRNGSSTGSGEERLLAEEEEHEWVSLEGVVVGLDDESLWIETDQEESLEITGRAWSFILESDFTVEIEDEVELEGFFEDDEFEVANLEIGEDSLQIREDSGRPLWSGGAGH